jgi:hypothetical protein
MRGRPRWRRPAARRLRPRRAAYLGGSSLPGRRPARRLRTPRAASSRASSGCTPACSSAKAARGRHVARRSGLRHSASSTAGPRSTGASGRPGAARPRGGRRSARRAFAAQRERQASAPARQIGRRPACQASAQARPSPRPAPGAQAVVDVARALGRIGRAAAAAEPDRVDTGSPRLARVVQRVVYSSICTSFCSRRSARVARPGSQRSTLRPITRSSEAVAGRPGFRGRRTSASARPSASFEAFAGEQLAHRLEEGARGGLVEQPALRVGQADLVGAHVPVHRGQQAPGQVAGLEAVGRRARPPRQRPSPPASPQARASARSCGGDRLVRRLRRAAHRRARPAGLQVRQAARQLRQGLAPGLGQGAANGISRCMRGIIPEAGGRPRRPSELG